MIFKYNEFLFEYLNTDFKLDILCEKHISFAKKIRYCDEHLVKIKSGSGRTVYKFEDKVIKVAKNNKGIAQNEVENDFVNFDYDILTKIYTYDYIDEINDNGYITIAEYADKITTKKFKELTGVDINVIYDYLSYYFDHTRSKRLSKDEVSVLDKNVWLSELLDICGTIDLLIGDLDRVSSYGIVKRNGKEIVVLVDYGLTNDVYREYYN